MAGDIAAGRCEEGAEPPRSKSDYGHPKGPGAHKEPLPRQFLSSGRRFGEKWRPKQLRFFAEPKDPKCSKTVSLCGDRLWGPNLLHLL